jgi:2-polyprenyl-6-methoxyphenol hydroxylase-like FAD-dependent oxidoreductase
MTGPSPSGSDVIVVGAGLSGLAAASALCHAGVPTTVLERVEEMRPVGAIIGVAANAASGLERIGLADLVENACIPVQRLEYVNWRGAPLNHMPIAEVAQELGTRTFIALRSDIQLGMYERLPAGVVQLGCECTGIDEDDRGATVRLADGRDARAPVVLGADGIHSVLRGQLHGDEPRYSGYGGWRGVAAMDPQPFPPGHARQVLGRGRTFGTFGLTEGRMYWWASALMEQGHGDSAAGRKADVRDTFAGGPEWVQSVIEATDEGGILRNDIFDRPGIERWGTRRTTLLGDAGHAATPNTGEGGSQAILDGVVLGEKLAGVRSSFDDGDAVQSALGAYESERIPQTSEVVKRAYEIGKFIHLNNPIACAFRNRIFYQATPQRIWRKRAAVYLKENL